MGPEAVATTGRKLKEEEEQCAEVDECLAKEDADQRGSRGLRLPGPSRKLERG